MDEINVYTTDYGDVAIPEHIIEKAQRMSKHTKVRDPLNDMRTRAARWLRKWAYEKIEVIMNERQKPTTDEYRKNYDKIFGKKKGSKDDSSSSSS